MRQNVTSVAQMCGIGIALLAITVAVRNMPFPGWAIYAAIFGVQQAVLTWFDAVGWLMHGRNARAKNRTFAVTLFIGVHILLSVQLLFYMYLHGIVAQKYVQSPSRAGNTYCMAGLPSLRRIYCGNTLGIRVSRFEELGARSYDAQVGRFITRDSELDQLAYVYCDGDPVNALDPRGHNGWAALLIKEHAQPISRDDSNLGSDVMIGLCGIAVIALFAPEAVVGAIVVGAVTGAFTAGGIAANDYNFDHPGGDGWVPDEFDHSIRRAALGGAILGGFGYPPFMKGLRGFCM